MKMRRKAVTYLSTFTSKLKKMWWYLWTGDDDLTHTRRRIEDTARRFGGRVHWDD